MIFFGILSLFQAWFLPGFLLVSFFKRINFYDKIILSFPLSIIVNYILIFILLFFNTYNSIYLYIIFGLEILAVCTLYKQHLFNLKNFKYHFLIELNLINIFLFLILFIYLYLSVSTIGQITFPGDPLVMWDNWAKSFALGTIPYEKTMDYPQAYPILMSITYVFIGNTDIEFFSRVICVIYPLIIWLIIFRILFILPNSKIKIKYFGIFLTLIILYKFRHTLFIGFVDPILIFSTLCLGYILFLDFKFKFKNEYILVCLLAILPGLLKQTSLYLSIIFPIIYFMISYHLNQKLNLKKFIFYFVFFVSILSPWYIYKIILFSQDQGSLQFFNLSFFSDTNNFVSDPDENLIRSFFLNIKYGLKLIFGNFYIVVLVIILIGIFSNFYTIITFFIILLPYFILWSNMFANDARNFSFLYPAVAFLLTFGLSKILVYLNFVLKNYFSSKLKINLFKNLILIFFLLTSFSLILVEKRNDEVLYKKQYLKELKRTNFPEINTLLYNYFNNNNDKFKIIMYDRDFTLLPGFENSIHISCTDEAIEYLNNFNQKFYYLINLKRCSKNFLEYFTNLRKKQKIFEYKNHILWTRN